MEKGTDENIGWVPIGVQRAEVMVKRHNCRCGLDFARDHGEVELSVETLINDDALS